MHGATIKMQNHSLNTSCVWTVILHVFFSPYTGRFIIFSMITNICNKKTKGPTLMELFTATGKLIFFFGI